MTKLEEEIKEALLDRSVWQETKMQSAEVFAKAAAEVAKKYIEQAFRSGVYFATYIPDERFDAEMKVFFKENGIIE